MIHQFRAWWCDRFHNHGYFLCQNCDRVIVPSWKAPELSKQYPLRQKKTKRDGTRELERMVK